MKWKIYMRALFCPFQNTDGQIADSPNEVSIFRKEILLLPVIYLSKQLPMAGGDAVDYYWENVQKVEKKSGYRGWFKNNFAYHGRSHLPC